MASVHSNTVAKLSEKMSALSNRPRVAVFIRLFYTGNDMWAPTHGTLGFLEKKTIYHRETSQAEPSAKKLIEISETLWTWAGSREGRSLGGKLLGSQIFPQDKHLPNNCSSRIDRRNRSQVYLASATPASFRSNATFNFISQTCSCKKANLP